MLPLDNYGITEHSASPGKKYYSGPNVTAQWSCVYLMGIRMNRGRPDIIPYTPWDETLLISGMTKDHEYCSHIDADTIYISQFT